MTRSELPAYTHAPEAGGGPVPQSRETVLATQPPKRHVISVLVKNVPGLLAQIANLFAARGYNIQSLTVAQTEDSRFSRMTITVTGEEMIIEALKTGLSRFINVIRVLDYTDVEHVHRDLALIKVHTPAGARQEIFQLVELFQGKVLDIGLKDCVIELVGPERKIDAFLALMVPYGIKEMARTGHVALARGAKYEGKTGEGF
jgi:acetolactate synthase-1/3 small subunit